MLLITNTISFKKTFRLILNLLKYFFTFFLCLILTVSLQDSLGYNEDIGFSFSLILSTICFCILLKLEGKVPFDFNINPIISIVIGLSGYLLCVKLFSRNKETSKITLHNL